MSRIGNKPIPLPSGVKVAVASDKIDVQGPKGKMSLAIPHGISFEQTDGVLNVKRATDIRPVVGGLGISIMTTPKGLMSGRAARKAKLGGEILCEVW